MYGEIDRDMIIGTAGLLAGAVLAAASINLVASRAAKADGEASQDGVHVTITAPTLIKSHTAGLVVGVFSDIEAMLFEERAAKVKHERDESSKGREKVRVYWR